MIKPGTPAPDFALRSHAGEEVTLAGFRGRRLLLCFYPKDFSPVCSDQLSLYGQIKPELDEAGVELVGVSIDHTWAHAAFRERLDLDFTLLADFHPRGEMSGAYGAYLDAYGTTNRSLVLIDEEGIVRWVHEADTPLEVPASALILDALAELA